MVEGEGLRWVETPDQADWLRRGPLGVKEAMLAYGVDDPCELVFEMFMEGSTKTVLFNDAIAACRAKVQGWYELWEKSRGTVRVVPTGEREKAWRDWKRQFWKRVKREKRHRAGRGRS